MDLKTFLSDCSEKSDRFLKSFFLRIEKEATRVDSGLKESVEIFKKYTEGGKKIRGSLTVLGYLLGGGKETSKVIPVSCGVEFFHNYLLIHDDIVDNDTLRRGKPTVHVELSKRNGLHFGLSKAIIIGDLGASLAERLILESSFDEKRKVKAFLSLNKFITNTIYGEILDIDSDYKKDMTLKNILKIRTYKTAYYTFVMPLTVGAILAGAPPKTLKIIENYGLSLGLAFQLKDDLLGVFGDPKESGKSNESDIREGKKTILFYKAVELADKKDKVSLLRWYGAKDINQKMVAKIKSIFQESGGVEYSTTLAKDLSLKSKKSLENLSGAKNPKKILLELSDFIISRKS